MKSDPMCEINSKSADNKTEYSTKIALVSCGYPDYNYRVKSIFTHEQVISLQKIGIIVDVFDSFADSLIFPKFARDSFENVTIYRISRLFWIKRPDQLISSLFTFRRLVREINYEYVIFNFLDIRHFPFIFILPRKIRFGIITHGTDAMALWENWFVRMIKKYILKRALHIFPVSDQTKFLIETIIPPQDYDKLYLNYNGINKEKFKTIKQRNKADIKKEMNISAASVILTVCDLVPRKGVNINLLADQLLLEEGIDFIHIIIGKGPEKEKLIRNAQNLGLSDRILWIDYIESDNELAKFYAIADVYTMISKTTYRPLGMEGFGISYIEAQYLGIPVVGGNSGGVSTAVKHGFTGFLVDPMSPNPEIEVAQHISRLIREPELYSKMSKNAHQYVIDNFDWDKNALFIRSVIRS